MKYDLSKKPTRGAKRTLGDFKDKMFLLLSKKAFEDITVNEICDEANYPRATFYNYFDDKYDLLNYCWLWLAKQIRLEEFRSIPHDKMLYIFFDRIFDFTVQHIEMIRKVLENNPEVGYMFSSFRNFMNMQMCAIFQNCSASEQYPIPQEMVANHYSNTILLVWQWCNFKYSNCTKEQAHEYLHYMIGSLQDI